MGVRVSPPELSEAALAALARFESLTQPGVAAPTNRAFEELVAAGKIEVRDLRDVEQMTYPASYRVWSLVTS